MRGNIKRISDFNPDPTVAVSLGLSITQRAVEIHGGTVTASNIPGGGLSVKIVLPIAPDTNRSDLQAEPLVGEDVG
jgi:K+-sensing histidine kinase KdpD